ncbi:hypothetical protein ACFX2J_027169 [Malus domestica]
MASHTPNLECQIYETRYLDVNMAMMIQVKNITDIGVCASLLEYNNIEGMILFSELSHCRIRSGSYLIKVGRIEHVMVLRVNKDGEYDKDKDRRWSNQQHHHMETCKNNPLLLAVLVGQLLDSFYHNLTEEELKRVHEYNFNHLEALDIEKLLSSMDKLKHGQAVDIPNYDFKNRSTPQKHRLRNRVGIADDLHFQFLSSTFRPTKFLLCLAMQKKKKKKDLTKAKEDTHTFIMHVPIF